MRVCVPVCLRVRVFVHAYVRACVRSFMNPCLVWMIKLMISSKSEMEKKPKMKLRSTTQQHSVNTLLSIDYSRTVHNEDRNTLRSFISLRLQYSHTINTPITNNATVNSLKHTC